MEMEVICISSDDESDSQKKNKTDVTHTKMEILFSDNEKVQENSLKRKKLQIDEDEINENNMAKRRRFLNEGTSEVMKLNKDQEVTIEKMQLVVKETKKVSYISQDVFPSFISLCLQKCPKHDREDMIKIVDKLKRRYENLDPIYVASENFVTFLNEKREAIITNCNKSKIYVYIEEVMNEMKKMMKKKYVTLQKVENYDAVPSTSYATNNVQVNNKVESDNDYEDYDDNENDNQENRVTRKKINKVLKTMKKCEEIIKKIEEEEVDLDDDTDSSFIKLQRYKRRMVELYNKLCELTGENTDAGRVYLRPKHLNLTRIVAVDQAITNFINSKIIRRNQIKRMGILPDDLIFPDYTDILECITRCNVKKNLGLDEKRRKLMAKKAFKELGEHLQRMRFNDYWDTFSLDLENSEDPAIKDKNLAKKLADNRTEGDKRLAAVFEKYVVKQDEIKDQNNEEIVSEEEDKESIENEDKNNDILLTTSENDSEDSEENIDKIVEENKLLIEKDKSNLSMVNKCHVIDEVVSNKPIVDTSKEKCNKMVEIKILKNDTAALKNKSKTINEEIHKPCSNNTILNSVVKNCTGTKTQEDSSSSKDSASSAANCTKDLAEVEAIEATKAITDPATKKATKDVADIITGVTTELIPGDTTELITGDAAELITGDTTELITGDVAERITGNTAKLITGDTTGLITGDTTELITGDTAELITGDISETITRDITETITGDITETITGDITETITENTAEIIMNETEIAENAINEAIDNMPDHEQEEKKPLLRLRSFAKPPMTWEDSQHKIDKTTQENAPKIANQIREVVDLTNEGTVKPVNTKRAVPLAGKAIPVVKQVVIPANSNIISVQNTNNYLKVNMRTGQIITPVHGPTIIRLPYNLPVQSTSRQGQPQNTITVRSQLPLKGKEILRVLPKKPIVVSNKLIQSASKKTDTNSSTTK